jgi:dUTP pyrophosphatase
MENKIRGFEVVSDEFRKYPNVEIQLPQRGDSRSAGYDFYAPCDLEIYPNEKILVFSDVKAYMQEDEVLLLYVRSSLGIKCGVVLSNGTGVIDSSYYNNPSNNGNIGIALHNTSDRMVVIKQGDRIIQGIFMKYLVADVDCVIHENRVGGIGSSNR